MNSQFAFSLFVFWIGFVWLFYIGPVRWARNDAFRASIRRVRDELFDFMWQNGYDYDTPAYRMTRRMLNGAIRYSDRISIASFVVVWQHRDRSSPFRMDWTGCDERLRRQLEITQAVLIGLILSHALFSGVPGLVIRTLLRLSQILRIGKKRRERASVAASTTAARMGQWVTNFGGPADELTESQHALLCR